MVHVFFSALNSYSRIKAQKVHLFRPSLGFLVEAEQKTGEDKGHFLTF
jgi:hypothetical protein